MELAAEEEVVGGGPEDPVADGAALLTIGVGVFNAFTASGDGDRQRSARTDAAEGRDRSASENRQPAAKSLKATTPVGARVKTPANSPKSFTKLKNGQGLKENKTGTIMQKSNTNHSNSPEDEYKAGLKPGATPTPSAKVTIYGGRDGGCVLKKDGC